MKAAVIGCPVGHSLSPLTHNYWLKKCQIEGRYDAQEIQPGQLKEGLARLIEQGYTGFSVTIPHKQAVMDLCDVVDDTAKRIGAINCIAVDRDGRIEGLNTDWFGFTESVREAAPEFDFTSGPALVLGAGGAARAIVYGLLHAGAPKTIIANRTLDKARELAGEFGVEYIDWADRQKAAAGAGVVVNTTAAGMTGKPPLEFDVKNLKKDALVCDIVYSPLRTALLESAAAHGNMTVEGLGMLLHQARPAFERWTGVLPAVTDELRHMLLEKLKK
jgi:shikimate dehydrogenase